MTDSKPNPRMRGVGCVHKNEYGTKTVIGNWLEEAGGPTEWQREKQTEEFMTESQYQQVAVIGNNVSLGSTVKSRKTFTTKDVLYPPEGPNASWETTTLSMTMHTKKTIPYKSLKPTMSKEQLEEYRAKYSKDSPEIRGIRYTTDTLQGSALRRLPGTPMGFERLRNQLSEKFGVLGLTVLRATLGRGPVSEARYNRALDSLALELSKHDLNTVKLFFMASGDSFDADEFLRRIVDDSGGLDRDRVRALFQSLFRDRPRVDVEDVQGMISVDVNVKLAESLSSYIGAYTGADGLVGEDEFLCLHTDMYESVPAAYETVSAKLF